MTKRTLTAVYDFAVSPASYDFVLFLVGAAIYRDVAGYMDVHVVFVPADTVDGFRRDRKPISVENKIYRRDSLVVPLCRLINATHTVCQSREHAASIIAGDVFPEGYTLQKPIPAYWFAEIRDRAASVGNKLPRLHVDAQARDWVASWVGDGPYITLTYRDTYGEARNSNKANWRSFGEWATDRGWNVIHVPDTEQCGHPEWSGVGVAAAMSPLIRHALYAGSSMNLGISGAALAVCWFGDLPFLSFKMVADYYSTKPAFLERYGLPVNTQLPWAKTNQRLVWEADDLDVIKKHFQEVMPCMERKVLSA